MAKDFRGNITSNQYYIENDQLKSRQISTYVQTNSNRPGALTTQKEAAIASIKAQEEASRKTATAQYNVIKAAQKEAADAIVRENNYKSLASQIQGLASSGSQDQGGMLNQALSQLSAKRNFGASDLSTKLNFQVSDDQILNDYNTSTIGALKSITDRGNAQIVGITERINSAQSLLNQLPAEDPRRTASENYVKQLKEDLASVQSAVVEANSKTKDFKPITINSPEGASQITSFREYLQLPEERATQQLKQIDPESYQTSVALGQKYRESVTTPIGQTQNAQTESFRSDLEKAYKDYSMSGTGKTLDEQTEAYRAQLQKQIQDYSTSQIGATTDPATEQLRKTLTSQYSDLANSKLGPTTTAQTDALRSQLEKSIGDYSASQIGATTNPETEAYRKELEAKFRGLTNEPLPSTSSPEAEALRRDVQQRLTSQVALGSAVGAEEQRQYQQQARAAQTARGNIYGLAPALEEAVNTGIVAEQRGRERLGAAQSFLTSGATTTDALQNEAKLQEAIRMGRFGASQGFLSSGQSVSDAAARDVQLRNALEQSKLGIGQQFLASGQSTGDALGRDVALRSQLEQNKLGSITGFLGSGETTSAALARDASLRDALQQGRYQTGGAMLASGQTTSDALAKDVALRNSIQLSKLGAGSQFLSSGQAGSDALQREAVLRDSLLQTRLGSASGFLSGGPTAYNLSNQRTAQQQNAMQQYVQANQSLPGSFGQGASTASNFYQATDPNGPLALQQSAVSLYNGLLGYQANTYGNMLQAQNQQQSGTQQFAQIAGGIGNIFSPISSAFTSYTLGGK